MKTRVYLRDWFYNAGIVGFIRIIEKSNENLIKIQDNYIEFDTEQLRDFSKYYFEYFFNKYNIANRTKERIDISFNKVKNNLLEDNINKEKIKSEKNYIKQIIKTQLDKIKKFDKQTYNLMYESYLKIDKIKGKEDIDKLNEIKEILVKNLEKDNINKKLSMNLFKNILSKSYFGQQSFLNVVKTSLSYEEQEELMYKDYISNIIETGFLIDIINGKYEINEISEYINNINENLMTKQFIAIYTNINKKYIQKGKSLEKIQEYIQQKFSSSCYMCENEKVITSNYSEGNFIPLAVSSDNMRNFFWNQNASFPICDICKLILFCIPAGITSTTKVVKENGIYKEKELLSFVNYDTNIDTLVKTNNSFSDNSKLNKERENPYSKLILDIVTENKQISIWQLQNIFVVEFEAEYLAFSRVEYFNIKKYVANFFKKYSETTLNNMKDYKYKLQIVDYILKNKNINNIINDRLRQELQQENRYGYNSFLATKIRVIINLLKKEESDMEGRMEKSNKKLMVLYNLGIQIHEELKDRGEEKKLDGYAYKMLNCIRTENKKDFMEMIIKLHMSIEKDVSPIFIETMQDGSLDFASIGHSFLSGLISNKYVKKEEEI